MLRIAAIVIAVIFPTASLATSEVVRSLVVQGRLFHAGSVALEAYPHWDEVVIGPIPAIAGAIKYGKRSGAAFTPAIKVVAIITQDRLAHGLMIAQKAYNAIAAAPSVQLPGKQVILNSSSTAQIYAARCLKQWNVTLDQMTVNMGEEENTGMEEAEIRKAVDEGRAEIAFSWVPFTYLVGTDRGKAKPLDCASVGALDLPTLIVARSDLLDEADLTQLAINKAKIAKFVAEYLGAWSRAVPPSSDAPSSDAIKRLRDEYATETINITADQAKAELKARRPPDLNGQRAAFTASPGSAAALAATLDSIMDFMVSSGTIKAAEKPAGSDLIDGSILEAIAKDPALTAIANGVSH